MISYVKRWFDRRRRRAERKRKLDADLAKLTPAGREAVRHLLNASMEAGHRMRGYR